MKIPLKILLLEITDTDDCPYHEINPFASGHFCNHPENEKERVCSVQLCPLESGILEQEEEKNHAIN